ncbi:GAF sensor domain-containing protein [Desulfonema limicola]|uniref:histidine kinase n=2 Tax=Desulfonema limicola TaxID=45656 RepID=A0A975B7D2_9BACT|nr:GAF sensor domain-containing protein [Desulfonema limicola]
MNRQYRNISENLIQKSFSIINKTLEEKEQELLKYSRQMASAENIGINLKYISENKNKSEHLIMQATYENVRDRIYTIAQSVGVSEAAIYDADGELTVFALSESGSFSYGYRHKIPKIMYEITELKKDTISSKKSESPIKSIKSYDSFDKIPSNLEKAAYTDKEIVRYEVKNNFLYMVYYAPVMGQIFNVKTMAVEPRQFGVLMVSLQLGLSFIKDLAAITGTRVNLFTGQGLSAGTLSSYKTFDMSVFKSEDSANPINGNTVVFTEVNTDSKDFVQGTLPVRSGNETVAAFASLYSKDIAKANTWQVIRLLCLIFLCCIFLFIPFAFFVSNYLTKAFNIIVDAANCIARGDFDKEITICRKDEIGDLADAFRNMKDSIGHVTLEMDKVIQAVQNGRLDVRCNTKEYKGIWQNLVTGVNNVIDAFADPVAMTAESIDRISKGDIPEKISDKFKGDFNIIRNNLNILIDAMNEITLIAEAIAAGNLNIAIKKRSKKDSLMEALKSMTEVLNTILQETGRLTRGVQDGRLDIRGREDMFSGGWQELILGFNSLIEAFRTPVNVTAGYISRISKGDIPEKINEKYKGDFNEIKNNINSLIDVTNKVTKIAQEIAQGNLSVKADKRSEKDEIMKAFANMITYLQDIADITEKVSNNELEVNVVPKSDKDILNRSLEKMIKNLQDMMNDIQNSMNTVKQQNWLKTGLAELGNTMRGEQEVSILAQNTISFLADYLNAQIGTIYLEKEKDRFYLAGSYACEKSKGIPEIIEAGQGLTGQAALEKKSILFSDVPKDYLNIYSGLGRSVPKNILVFPLIYEKQVKGVAEIGTFGSFSEIETDFLTLASENIAIAFDAAQTREKMKILLEESRQQAEELRMQQAELQAVNKELELQTGLSAASDSDIYQKIY